SPVGLPARGELLAPAIVDLAENARDHAAHLVARRAGLALPGRTIGLIRRRLAAAVENFGAADQDAGIDAEGVGNETEHDDGADARPTAADRQTQTAATAHPATGIVAAVFDVVAAAEIIVTHGDFPSFQFAHSSLLARGSQAKTKICNPLIN